MCPKDIAWFRYSEISRVDQGPEFNLFVSIRFHSPIPLVPTLLIIKAEPSGHGRWSSGSRQRRGAMGSKIEFQGCKEQESQPDRRVVEKKDFQMGKLEARLQELSERLTDFHAEPELVRPKSGPHVFDPALDLRIKVDAVRWMLRVAKHVEGPARERILLVVNSSLDQLERAVNQRPHAA
jgi:hypothetical protein